MEKVLWEGDAVVEKMTRSKVIVPPSGMMMSVAHALHALSEERGRPFVYFPEIPCAVEAALRWISENPIVPNPTEIKEILDESYGKYAGSQAQFVHQVAEWQRRMFLAPEPNPIVNEIRERLAGRVLTAGDAVELIDAIRMRVRE